MSYLAVAFTKKEMAMVKKFNIRELKINLERINDVGVFLDILARNKSKTTTSKTASNKKPVPRRVCSKSTSETEIKIISRRVRPPPKRFIPNNTVATANSVSNESTSVKRCNTVFCQGQSNIPNNNRIKNQWYIQS